MHKRRGTPVVGDTRGFTLVEMLISLSIFAVVTAFAMANFRVGQQGDELRTAAQLTASLIRRAQTQAIAGYVIKSCEGGVYDGRICVADIDCSGGFCGSGIPPAYGINISTLSGEEREVRIFADTNNNAAYDQGEAIRFDPISPGPFVAVSSVSPSAGGALDILFTPPKPTVKFNGSEDSGIAEIVLRHVSTGKSVTITVNRISGLITID